MDRYVDECADVLLTSEGRRMRRVADRRARTARSRSSRPTRSAPTSGLADQHRPDGMPRVAGVVLPVIADGHAVYAQVRVPHPRPDGPRYLNPTADLAPNPRLAYFRPAEHGTGR